MKKLLTIILLLGTAHLFAQNYPITGLNISIPANPGVNTADWGQAASPFSISAQTKLDSNRQVNPFVMESRIVVTIKKGGGKVCGTYTSANAPLSNFNAAFKVWNGRSGVSLLGQDCVLPAGQYELCVQFFGNRNGSETAFSDEKCKTFIIAGTDNISYQPPQNITPADGTVIKEADAKKPVTFRWTPVVPKPKGDVLYKVRVVEIRKGQSKTEAIRINTPIEVVEVKNVTQTIYKPAQTYNGLVWDVEAVSAERMQGGQPKSYGKSDPTIFDVKSEADTGNCCKNGSWYNKVIYYGSAQTPPALLAAPGSNLGTLLCKSTRAFQCGYSCAQGCAAQINYSIYTSLNVLLSSNSGGSNAVVTLTTPNSTGSYKLVITAICGKDTCNKIVYPFEVKCQQPNNCCQNATQKDPAVYDAAGTNLATFSCVQPKVYDINAANKNCDKELFIKASANCGADTNCRSKIVYTLVNTSTGAAITGIGILSIPASLANGVYTLTADYYCGNTICKSCKFEIKKDCSPIDCCKGGKWTNKSLDWDIKIKVQEAEAVELSNKAAKNAPAQKQKDQKKTTGIIKAPVDRSSGQLNPLSGSLKVEKCGDTIKINEGNEFTLNAAYTCNAALANCTGKVIAKVKDPAGITYGTWPLPHLFKFTAPGVYTVTYYAYCGDIVCDSCTFYVNAAKDCCKGSRWIKAEYQITNKKPNGDWDKSDQAYYPLPLTISSPIPVLKADVAIDLEKLGYSCATGCTAGFILKRKNLITGVEETPEIITAGGTPSVYAKPYPQLITIIPTCAGISCGNPIIFKLECLNKDCMLSDCMNQLIQNGDFTDNMIAGTMPGGSVQHWSKGYGSPYLSNTPGTGCFDDGLVKLSGNSTSGDAIAQTLSTTNQIVAGKKYKVSIAVKFQANQNVLDYAKLRVIAFNGTLLTSGIHASPNSNVAIIGRSGKIRDCGDWSVRVFITWTATNNFQKIAINVFTDNNTSSNILIDNVSICETVAAGCDELAMDQQGNPIPPIGLQAANANSSCYSESDESYYNGSLVDLYGYNGTFGMYQALSQNECNSIGDILPDAITNYNCDDSLRAAGITITCDSIDRLVNSALPAINDTMFTPAPIAPLTNNPRECQYGLAKSASVSDMAFNGRDIIYIHGLQLDHLIKRTQLDPRAVLNWPLNRSEFNTGGYYKNVAEANWDHHITHCLKNQHLKNRYFIASYNCSERADVAIYNLMNQIREAMENGTGVVADSGDVRGTKCFARDFVIISHSTGGLIADLVLSTADLTKTNLGLQSRYGNVGYISDRCKGHIAMHGAMGGSNLAKICVATALPIMVNSILVDLTPDYTYTRWSYFLNRVPKPVFTIAGGQPNDLEGSAVGLLLTALGRPDLGSIAGTASTNLLPGTDDGVVNMESGSGRNKPFALPVSQFFTLLPNKAFDLGINLDRSVSFYLDQRRLPGFFSIGSTPYLTQSGMVEPHHNIVGMHAPWNNHYTFIQSAAEHVQPTAHAYYNNGHYGYMNIIGSANYEEQLVTNDLAPYNNGLIDPAIINKMGEEIRGKKIVFTWFKIIMKNGLPKFVTYDIEFYLWKRTYHNLVGNFYDVDYAYKYLFVN